MKVKSESEVAQPCPTRSDPMDYSLPGSSVHGVFQARILDGVPLPSPTICKISSQWKFAVWLRNHKQGICINLEVWDGEGDGREFQKGGDICIPVADSC